MKIEHVTAHDYPRLDDDAEVSRPFRLWNTELSAFMPWRYYKYWNRAWEGAVREIIWAEVGTTLEVLDYRTGSVQLQLTRTPTQIKVTEIKRGKHGDEG